jgi:hypothetical protein
MGRLKIEGLVLGYQESYDPCEPFNKLNHYNMEYCIVIRVNNLRYLEMITNEEDKAHHIMAYHSLEEAKDKFSSFYRRFGVGNSYETHTSAGMGIVFLNPHIIGVEAPEMLRNFILEEKVYSLRGIGLGYALNHAGLPVSEDILKLSVLDIAHDVIWRPEEHKDKRDMFPE